MRKQLVNFVGAESDLVQLLDLHHAKRSSLTKRQSVQLFKSRSYDDLTHAEDTGGGKMDGMPRRRMSDSAIDKVEEGGRSRSGDERWSSSSSDIRLTHGKASKTSTTTGSHPFVTKPPPRVGHYANQLLNYM